MTNVPFPTLGPNGFTAPDEAAILAGVQADINAAFGGGLNPGLSTPQGQLGSSVAAIIGDCFNQFLAYSAQQDPQYAQGRMQDAIGAIYFQTRFPATSTTVSGNCNGLAGTPIPAGVPVAQDGAGNLYTCAGGAIPLGGSLPMTFTNQATGPIPFVAPLTIYQTTPGWDTINTPTLIALGENVETQQAFEARRQKSVAANANGMCGAVYGAVLASGQTLSPANVPSDAYVTENTSSSPAIVGGVTLAPNSIYVAALGGDNQSIANAIWSKKSGGCNYNGNTTMTVTDTSRLNAPYPTYQVSFQRPSAVPTFFQVTLRNNPALPGNVVALVQAAIVAAFQSKIGATVYASDFYEAAAAVSPVAQVVSILVGTGSPANTSFFITNINQYPSIDPTGASVNVVLV